MAIKLIATYCKRLGLPGFSSHQFSISLETELVATDDISAESERLYHLLQTNVDEQIQSTGFVPHHDYGMDDSPPPERTITNGHTRTRSNGSVHPAGWSNGTGWKCSDKQRDLILRIVEEHQLDKSSIETLSNQRFGKGVRSLNKMEASGLIDELLDTHGSSQPPQHATGQRRTNGSVYANRGRAR